MWSFRHSKEILDAFDTVATTLAVAAAWYVGPVEHAIGVSAIVLLDRDYHPVVSVLKAAGVYTDALRVLFSALASIVASSVLFSAARALKDDAQLYPTAPLLDAAAFISWAVGCGALFGIMGSLAVLVLFIGTVTDITTTLQLFADAYAENATDPVRVLVNLQPLSFTVFNRAPPGFQSDASLEALAAARVNESPDEERNPCPICLEPVGDKEVWRELPCSHIYHAHCCDPWLRTHSTCPVCKTTFPVSVESSEEEEDSSEEGASSENDDNY